VRPFTPEFINPKILETFLRQPELIIEKRNLSQINNDKSMFLYEYDVVCDYFIIILDGTAQVQVGKERMEINAGLFSYYGISALLDENEKDATCVNDEDDHDTQHKPYKPEFSLIVTSYCVYLKVTRKNWKDAVKKTLMERMYHGAPSVPANSALAKTAETINSSTSNQALNATSLEAAAATKSTIVLT
jgi:hypothetical protein